MKINIKKNMIQKTRTNLERLSKNYLSTKIEVIYNFIHIRKQRKWGYILQ